MKKIIILLIMSIIIFSNSQEISAVTIHADILEGYKCKVNSIRFVYDGKIHKPSVNILDSEGESLIPSLFSIKYQNENSISPGRYKFYIYDVYNGEIMSKTDTIYYEIVKAPKSKKQATKEIKKFINNCVRDSKKKNINKVFKKYFASNISYHISSYHKKLMRQANKKGLKMNVKKINLSKNKEKAIIKIKTTQLNYSKAFDKTGTLCYKNAVKDGYFDDPIIMSSYKFTKNLKKAIKKYPPTIKKKTIKIQVVKTYKKGWIVTGNKEDGSKIKKSEDLLEEVITAGL